MGKISIQEIPYKLFKVFWKSVDDYEDMYIWNATIRYSYVQR